MNILVIGAGSYMSNYVIPELLKRKHAVTATYHNSVKKIAGVQYVALDISKPEQFAALPLQIDLVINFSAYIGEDEAQCRSVNVDGMKNILAYCAKANVKTLIHSSSTAVYGKPQFLPVTEQHPLQPNTNYGKSKLEAEKLIQQEAATHGFGAVLFRYASPFGFGQKVVSVLPLFIQKTRAGETLEYFGDGSRTQEFIYVKDIATAHLLALKSKASGAFNIGSSNIVTMKQLAELIAAIFGNGKANVASKNQPDTGMPLVIDSSKAARAMGFHAAWDLKTALEDYARYVLKA